MFTARRASRPSFATLAANQLPFGNKSKVIREPRPTKLLIPKVLKIQRYPEIFPSQELDHRLQIILLLSGDSDLAIL
jgi:hypothetical protein